jgi:hypothetical protein
LGNFDEEIFSVKKYRCADFVRLVFFDHTSGRAKLPLCYFVSGKY